MRVNKIIVDWFYTTGESGEEYVQYEVGKNNVLSIEYHEPKGEGDRHYCDVTMEDGIINREFNLNSIVFV